MPAVRALLRARLWPTPSSCSRLGFRSLQLPASHYLFSSMAAPFPSASSNFIPGRADAAGTAEYAQKIGSAAGPGHFRTFRVGGDIGNLVVSSIGIGTYLGSDTDAADREYIESITRSLTMGINIIDSAANYRNMRSELAIGQCLAMAIRQGIIKRNEVIVCTKGGFLAFDYRESIEPRTYIDDKYIKTGLFKREEFVGACHCLSAPYLKNQLELSRRNFGLETIDVYFVHNPETQLSVVSRQTLLPRIKAAFEALEECVQQGKISMYGVATWNGFRINPSGKLYLSLEELVSFAKDVAGDNHNLKVVQLPYNSTLQEGAKSATQSVRGKRFPLLHAAHHLGLSVIASATLNQSNLCKNLNPEIRNKFADLGEQRTDAQCALQFARTTPGVMTALAGMRRVMHVEENGALISRPANPRV